MIGKRRKIRTGVVVSDKMHKTIVVRIECFVAHSRYAKRIKRSNKFKVHDEKNAAKIGDLVKITETRPLSKDKRWRLLEIINRKED
jgi:small subunit ribosomal protein S17